MALLVSCALAPRRRLRCLASSLILACLLALVSFAGRRVAGARCFQPALLAGPTQESWPDRSLQQLRGARTQRQLFQGSVLDPGYWSKQFFLSGDLTQCMPAKEFCAIEMAPIDNKNMAYMCPENEEDGKLTRYIGVFDAKSGDMDRDENTRKELMMQSGVKMKRDAQFQVWQAGRKTNLLDATADVVLFGPSSLTRLGESQSLGPAIQEARRLAKQNARVIIVLEKEEDERNMLGVPLEEMLDAHDLDSKLPGDLLDAAGLQLLRTVRDDRGSGLILAICALREQAPVKKTKASNKRQGGAKKVRRR
eukprot:TRINITY_DN102476_c0_g1_i1.p1 TRINITY_DN102476_c0_g1~~TRINITY_DN102476_c0_g1_i1.p1  ORF type:complete len:332 (+),score=43.75 TRINITY_DN102476_c0_g1_i1:74-997(+)